VRVIGSPPGPTSMGAPLSTHRCITRGMPGNIPFQGGRAAERGWLTASARGLALQPMTALVYLIAPLEAGRDDRLTDAPGPALEGFRHELRRWFPARAGCAEVMLFHSAWPEPVLRPPAPCDGP
jgi:hypothetical protein